MSTYKGTAVCRNERIGTRMRLAGMNLIYLWSSIIQRTVCRAVRLHARKQSVAWPRHSDVAAYYLQSVVRFRCSLYYYDGVYMSGGSLPSARHTILLIAFAYQGIIARVSSAGNVNTRLPVAVKPTSMHVLVCTYEGPIYRRPLYLSLIHI